ncbi:glycosyltransferase family 4 protein [Campylobacter sp.]|uniref:glycosyltransferase family 4 protein n=1 Tax=Campylobacter sp. TaxID=205 RepID=UPI00270A3C03|nr:glycosyltransferase family 4 protein [Campylobacter sp.]
MKKILFIDTGIECGGGTRSLVYLLKELVKSSKYKLFVFFEKDYEIDGRSVCDVMKDIGVEFVKFEKKPQISKIKREILRLFSKEILAEKIYQNDLKFAVKLLKSVSVDAIYLNNHFSTNLAYIKAANMLGINVIQHLRKNATIEKFKLEILKSLKFTPISVSNSTYKFYANQLKLDKNIVYDPVVCSKNLSSSSEDGVINLIMCANFLELKGHELVFDALLKLKREDIRLSLAGSGKFKPQAQQKFERLQQTRRVVNLGFVNDMSKIYSKGDYLIGFSSDEGMPRVVIEALSHGLGVIFSDLGAIREIYEISSNKENFYILKRDSNELLKCLENLKKPSFKAQDISIIKAFSMDNYIKSIDKILQEKI